MPAFYQRCMDNLQEFCSFVAKAIYFHHGPTITVSVPKCNHARQALLKPNTNKTSQPLEIGWFNKKYQNSLIKKQPWKSLS